MVPEDWTRRELGEIVERVSRRGGDDLPVLTVSKDLGIVLQTEKFDRILASDDRSRYKRVRRGEFAYDPMLLWSGSIARQKRVPEGVVSPAYYVFTVNEEEVDPEYFEHFITADRMNTHYEAISEGTNKRRRKARFKDFSALEFPFPPIAEQESIAAILSTVDNAIAATRKVIEQTKRVKKGLLQDLMTRGIGHKRFKETVVGEIPAEWEVHPADAVCQKISVGIVVRPASHYVDEGVPCIRSANISESGIVDEDWVYISKESSREHEKSILREGDVVVVRSGDPGTACVVPPWLDSCNCVDVIFARPDTHQLRSNYLSLFLNSYAGKKQVLQKRGGLAQKHLNVGALKEMLVPVPPLEEQEEIINHISAIAAAETASTAEKKSLETLKRGLMQDLLTGRVRVPID